MSNVLPFVWPSHENMESNNNLYLTPNDATDENDASRQSSLLGLVRKVLLTCVWVLVLLFGSAMLLGFASGVYFATASSTGSAPTQQAMEWIGFAWAVVPMILGATGLVLGILGYLPGTRLKTRSRIAMVSSSKAES